MQIKHILILVISILLFSTGCEAEISGTVVDAETGQPIEGAVVLVEWTVTKGLGLTYSESYKVIEVVTDKDGKVTISGVFNPFVNPPDVTIYKKGYAAWNNKFIFPSYEKRKDFKWENGYVFKLERFKDSYSYDKHMAFVTNAIHTNLETKDKQLFLKLYYEAELKKVREELDRKEREGR